MPRTYTVDELAALPPAERQRLFDESVVTDLSTLPDGYVDGIRDRFLAQLGEESTDRA